MPTDKYDCLKLENQLCFPLYAASKEIIKQYTPFLKGIDLTYTQYITMMVMWEYKQMNVKELGEYVYLDSGTMTPVLKKLEEKGLVSRERSKKDERTLIVTITEAGEALKEKAVNIPKQLMNCVKLDIDDSQKLYELLYRLLDTLKR